MLIIIAEMAEIEEEGSRKAGLTNLFGRPEVFKSNPQF
jgi:hypothetical protein